MDRRLVREIRHLHDQSLTLPVPRESPIHCRTLLDSEDARLQDDARVVDHFVQDHDKSRRLQNLIVVLYNSEAYHRYAASDTAIPGAQFLPRGEVGAIHAPDDGLPCACASRCTLPSGGSTTREVCVDLTPRCSFQCSGLLMLARLFRSRSSILCV